jgi:hypothetical protein
VTLTTSATSGRPVTCQWSVVGRPATSDGTFGNPTSCTGTSYFADVVGEHALRFTVTDSTGLVSSCEVRINVVPRGDLWVELTWDRENDMDLHLLHPSAGNSHAADSWNDLNYDCFWNNQNPPNWDAAGTADDASLDRDDIFGRGPENARINVPSTSHAYTIGVHMFSYRAEPAVITSTVRLFCGGVLKATQTRRMSRNRQMWVVGTVRFNSTGAEDCTFTDDDTTLQVP